jgi:hypothetical protein
MPHPQFTLKRSSNSQHYFNLTGANAEVVFTSEMYTSRPGAENGIRAVRDNAQNDTRYDRLPSADNQFYFVLRAANGEVIGRSETYTTRAARDAGIEAMKRSARVAGVGEG